MATIHPIVEALLSTISASGLAKLARVLLKSRAGSQQSSDMDVTMNLIAQIDTLEHAEGRLAAAAREVAACERSLRDARAAVIAGVFPQVDITEIRTRLYHVGEDVVAEARAQFEQAREQEARKAVRRKKQPLSEKE